MYKSHRVLAVAVTFTMMCLGGSNATNQARSVPDEASHGRLQALSVPEEA